MECVYLPQEPCNHFNPYNAELILYKPWRLKGFSKFEIIINILVSSSGSFEYICYGSTTFRNILILSVRGPSLLRQNLTSTDVRFWRIRTVPAMMDQPKSSSI